MARIERVQISGYRSIKGPLEIRFPKGQPVVLVGENNAGKSNIVRALNLVLGPFWPGNHDPDDHEFFGRDRSRPIEIVVDFDEQDPLGGRYSRIMWRYEPDASEPVVFRGGHGHQVDGYIRNDDRDTCMCIVVEAERNLGYHLSYSSKWTFLSRLMHRFHRTLEMNQGVRTGLEDIFAQTKEKFYQLPEFRAFADDLREQFSDLVATMPHRLEVDFEAYNPVNFFHALRLQAVEGSETRTLEEMGTGEQQVLALAFAHAYSKAFHAGILLVVEEPEAHLHPLAQHWLARRLRAHCAEGLQLLLTTHSPAFIDIEQLDGLVLVTKKDDSTMTRQLTRDDLARACIDRGAPPEKVSSDTILPFYAANATTDLLSGFFARCVLLVEGPTEALALPRLLARRGLDVEREGLAVLSVGGKGNLAKWCRLYGAYEIPTYIVFDNDPQDDGSAEKRRDALRAAGVVEDVAEIVEAQDWIVGERWSVFGTDFETSVRHHFAGYGSLEDEARNSGVESKPFIARWVSGRLDADTGDQGWKKVDELVRRLRALLQGGPGTLAQPT